MDCVEISGLEVRTIIGTLPEERGSAQKIVIDAELRGDFREAGRTDDFSKTFDYSAAECLICHEAEGSSFFLLEALAEHLAGKLLRIRGVQSVMIRIAKPAAAQFARKIAVRIERP